MNVLETAGLDISNHIIMIVGHIKSVLFAFHILDKNKYFFFDSLFQYIGCVIIILVAELVIGVYIAVERKNVSFQPTRKIHLPVWFFIIPQKQDTKNCHTTITKINGYHSLISSYANL